MSKSVQPFYYLVAFDFVYEFDTYRDWFEAKELKDIVADRVDFEFDLKMQDVEFTKQEQKNMKFYSTKFERSYALSKIVDTEELLTLQEDCETEEEFTSILKAEEVFYQAEPCEFISPVKNEGDYYLECGKQKCVCISNHQMSLL